MRAIIQQLQKSKRALMIGVFLVLTFFSGNLASFSTGGHASQAKVLGVSTHIVSSPTPSPAPTVAPITIINNIILPTQAPVILPTSTPMPMQMPATPTPTPLSQPTSILTPTSLPQPTSTPMPTPLPTSIPTPSLTPMPTQIVEKQSITIEIDYAGEHAADTYTVSITPGENAWQAVQDAIGLSHIQYTDYGGNLGIFITGFNGINASANQYYDFHINGVSASVGVSSYTVVDKDVLQFVLTNF